MLTLLFVTSTALIFPSQTDIYLEVVTQTKQVPYRVKNSLFFFAPHENEHVANQYVAEQILDKGGKFVVLRQKGTRLIELKIKQTTGLSQKWLIDPNRMFTDKGINNSLIALNPKLKKQPKQLSKATKKAQKLKQFVLTQLGGVNSKNTWVAMHNNTNGFDNDGKNGFGNVSIIRYRTKLLSGAKFLIDVTEQGQLKNNIDEDDLFYVTSTNDFNAMQQANWNAVLQSPVVVTDPNEDDGSLSVYAQMHNIRYINIESERSKTIQANINKGINKQIIGSEHLSVQKQMVDFTFSLVK